MWIWARWEKGSTLVLIFFSEKIVAGKMTVQPVFFGFETLKPAVKVRIISLLINKIKV
jgi:hypothetical protein